MSVIKVENLTFSYPSSYDNIFENVNFQIDTDWKLGFVGRNGRGKTTFLKLLMGKYEYRGKIVSSVQFDYFPYEVSNKDKITEDILYEVCPAAEIWMILREFSYLEIEPDVLYRPFKTLSNGEQTKVLLAALFLNEGHFLLIDEPTNHLDARGREMVSQYLNRKKGFILVSHDRNFLDGCVDHILSINRSDIEVQNGNFSSFMENFNRKQEFEQRQNVRLQADIKRLQQAAKQTAEWADRVEDSETGVYDKGYVGHCAALMMKHAKAVETRQQKAIKQKSELLKNVEVTSNLKILPLSYRSERLAVFSAVAPKYDGKEICAPVSFEIKRGERIALDGKNGCGKSSILKLLCTKNVDYSGDIHIRADLIISYVPQDTSFLHGNLRNFAAESSINESLFMAILHKTGINKDNFEKDISDLSEGQKKKILIAKSLCEQAHLYVWDEPLNFIDVYSRIQIEDLLAEFQPTMIFVEHDKAFRENIATKTILL